MRLIERLFSCDNWNIAIANKKDIYHLNDHDFKWFLEDKAEFIADPFLIEKDNLLYVFYEKLSLLHSKGELWCAIYNHDKVLIDNNKINGFDDLNCHLSFPFVFNYNNNFYCIPETNEINKLVLYRSESFPFSWIKEQVLLNNITIVDTVYFEFNDSCWLIGSDLNNTRLFFKSNNLLSNDWQQVFPKCSYASNHQRMAGAPFIDNNKLYFITQECGDGLYGNSLILSEIIKLDENNFDEKLVEQVFPFDEHYSKGIHTFNMSDKFIVIDSKRRKYSIFMPLIKLIYNLKTKNRLRNNQKVL
ncbi:hypothetical protein C9J22_18175 [Photobacterium phosphoreum]|uniref:glucosamine inositolphosphorylceramide transferase family protein n=1 Tax=Photobacterium phosphoreum TaxID=659 RepID=UPI000D16C2FE|nr:hypothetical protein [Photobacterium phosphoreum]PSU68045.1 hypothetical protein C9J22_18175 [Photobacterium phosphoreum]